MENEGKTDKIEDSAPTEPTEQVQGPIEEKKTHKKDKKKVKIDAFIASPAKRAAKTAKFFAETYNKKKDDIEFKEKLPVTYSQILIVRCCPSKTS